MRRRELDEVGCRMQSTRSDSHRLGFADTHLSLQGSTYPIMVFDRGPRAAVVGNIVMCCCSCTSMPSFAFRSVSCMLECRVITPRLWKRSSFEYNFVHGRLSLVRLSMASYHSPRQNLS